jgi:Protein of unknown function (DUF3830)
MAKIIITIEKQEFTAKLHSDRAPRTIESMLKILPYSSKVIHARFSGEAIWVPLPENFPVNVPLENQTSYPSKGELLYYPGFVSEKELLIPYGATIFSSRVGQLPGNHFATISEELGTLAEIGKKVLWEGAKDISFRLGTD